MLTISFNSEVYSIGPIVALLWHLCPVDLGLQFKRKAIQVITFLQTTSNSDKVPIHCH